MKNLAVAELLSAVAAQLEILDFEENAVALNESDYIQLLEKRIALAGLGVMASRFYAPAQWLGVRAITDAIADLSAAANELDADSEEFDFLLGRIADAQAMGSALIELAGN